MYNEAIIIFLPGKVNRSHRKLKKLTVEQDSEVRME